MQEASVQAHASAQGSRWSGLKGLVVFVVFGIGFFVIVQAVGTEPLRDLVASAGPLAPIAYVVLKACTVVVTPLSGTPLRLAAGALFGFWDGVLLSVLGGVLGGSANFWIARRFGRGAVARVLGPASLARVEPMLDRLADWRALALARVALAPLWDVLSYGIGLTKLRFRTYLAVAIVGDLIPSMILVAFGSSAAELGMAGAGTAGARAAETALPIALPMVTAGLGAVLLIVVGLVLRPRLGHLLVRPVRPTVGQSERAVNAAHEGRIDQSHAA